MVRRRTFDIRWISGRRGDAEDFDAAPDSHVLYSGRKTVVMRP